MIEIQEQLGWGKWHTGGGCVAWGKRCPCGCGLDVLATPYDEDLGRYARLGEKLYVGLENNEGGIHIAKMLAIPKVNAFANTGWVVEYGCAIAKDFEEADEIANRLFQLAHIAGTLPNECYL